MTESPRSPLAEISTGIARIYKARYGRGPDRITTHLHGDAIVCVLSGVNTPALASLVASGYGDTAQRMHGELQMSMAEEMSAMVQHVIGRPVTGYVPGFNALADATTDTFFLAGPRPSADAGAHPGSAAAPGPWPSGGDAAHDRSGHEGPVLTIADDHGAVTDALRHLLQALARTEERLDRLIGDASRDAHPSDSDDDER